jgi:tRNA(Arg) A34 adenosine deaminase TadA
MLNQEMQQKLMRIAMEEAELALARGDDPFGGVIADKEGIVERGCYCAIKTKNNGFSIRSGRL